MSIYTAFCFKGLHPNTLHVTHKYLGHIGAEKLNQVQNILADYFCHGYSFKGKIPNFFNLDEEDFFGTDKTVRVLRAVDFVDPFNRLRDILGNYLQDEFPYTPHLTTDLIEPGARMKPHRYSLVDSKKGELWTIEFKPEWYEKERLPNVS